LAFTWPYPCVLALLLIGAAGCQAPVPQPVAFNHLKHTKDLELECQVCHQQVNTGAHAGLPDATVLSAMDVDDFLQAIRDTLSGRVSDAGLLALDEVRLDADVLAHYRRTGGGWQSRINAALRKAAKLPAEKRKKA